MTNIYVKSKIRMGGAMAKPYYQYFKDTEETLVRSNPNVEFLGEDEYMDFNDPEASNERQGGEESTEDTPLIDVEIDFEVGL